MTAGGVGGAFRVRGIRTNREYVKVGLNEGQRYQNQQRIC